jgi:hypothetical protein
LVISQWGDGLQKAFFVLGGCHSGMLAFLFLASIFLALTALANSIGLFGGIIPIVFLAAGIVILALRMPGWSLLLGLPLTIFGTVFLIYTYDEVVRKTFAPILPGVTKCSVCGKPTPISPGTDLEDAVCTSCKREIKEGIKREK